MSWWKSLAKRQRTNTVRDRVALSSDTPTSASNSRLTQKPCGRSQSVDQHRFAVGGASSTLRCYADRQPKRPRQLSAGEELELLLRDQPVSYYDGGDDDADNDDIFEGEVEIKAEAEEEEEVDEIVDTLWSEDWQTTRPKFASPPHDPIDSPSSMLELPCFETPPISSGSSSSSSLSPELYVPQSKPSFIQTLFLGICEQLVEELVYCTEIDYWLIGMVFVYFRRLPENKRAWTHRVFYLLLYIAIQMEEEEAQELEWFVINRVLDTLPESRRTMPHFQTEKAGVWTALNYNTLVHPRELKNVLRFFPRHRIFALKRKEDHWPSSEDDEEQSR